ncbi:hypothetical protein ABZ383_14665 [Streptomyces sp. NPDC005900]|uniref:hypothetical protein n=1 Tax=Streptomyces sp. NPDC005900 TaxID=3154569 RepID=UPI00340F6820
MSIRRVAAACLASAFLVAGFTASASERSNGTAEKPIDGRRFVEPEVKPKSAPDAMELKGPSCAAVERDPQRYMKPGETVAVCFDSEAPKSLTGKRGLAASKPESEPKRNPRAASGDGTVWCDDQEDNTIWYTRTELCAVHDHYIVVVNKNGAPIGYADGTVKQEIDTVNTSTHFQEYLYYKLKDAIGDAKSITVEISAACRPGPAECHQGPGPWEGKAPMVPGTSLDGTWLREWTGTTYQRNLELVYTLGVTVDNGIEVGSGEAVWGYNTADEWKVRCDNRVGTQAGCVVPAYTPTFNINWEKYPGANAYIYAAQWKIKTHPGKEGSGEPLHREADFTTAVRNRTKVCDGSFKVQDNFTGMVDDRYIPAEFQCDEYPFAKSKESGGQLKIDSGKECKQYALWPGYTNPAKYSIMEAHAPHGAADCARATMDKRGNEGVGGDLGRFTVSQRLLDDDAYWVHAEYILNE